MTQDLYRRLDMLVLDFRRYTATECLYGEDRLAVNHRTFLHRKNIDKWPTPLAAWATRKNPQLTRKLHTALSTGHALRLVSQTHYLVGAR